MTTNTVCPSTDLEQASVVCGSRAKAGDVCPTLTHNGARGHTGQACTLHLES